MTFTQTQFAAQAPLNANVVCLEFVHATRVRLRGSPRSRFPVVASSWMESPYMIAVTEPGATSCQASAWPRRSRAPRRATGKVKYSKIMEFTDKRKAYAFSDEVIAAVQKKRAAQ